MRARSARRLRRSPIGTLSGLVIAPFTLALAIGCSEPATTGDSTAAPAAQADTDASPGPAADTDADSDAEAVAADATPPDGEATSGGEAGAEAAEPGEGDGDAVDPPDSEVPDRPRRVLIVGASLAATGFGAVLEDKLDARPDVVCYRKGKSASGLSRPDFYDWDDQAKRQVEFRKPDLVIVIIGANDGQDLVPWRGSDRVKWQTDGWPAGYRGRVDTFLASLTTPQPDDEGNVPEHGSKVVWLGLPKMGSPSLERKLEIIRGVQREAVEALGDQGRYVETNDYLVDADGALIRHAEVRGKNREIRAEDGVHLTMSGSEYLADMVYPEIIATLNLPAEPPVEPETGP